MALINGDNSRNVLTGTSENDVLFGFGGDDELTGGDGDDMIDGGPGNDLLGIMQIYGPVELGNDLYIGGPGNDRIGAGIGADTIYGGSGDDVILADSSLIRGLDGSDDWISGGPGSDTIDGGPRVDTAAFELPRHAYGVQIAQPGTTVTLGSGASQDTDLLSNIEILQFVDGRIVTTTDDPLYRVFPVFEVGLGRHPDIIGLNLWEAQLSSGLLPETFASAVVASPEFLARFGVLDNQAFVQQLYQNTQDRQGDVAQVAAWTAELDAGASRGEVVLRFAIFEPIKTYVTGFFEVGVWDQDEHAAQTARLYDTVFNRLPDLNGFLANKAALDAGSSLEQLAHNYMESAEFTARYGGPDVAPEALVNALYSNGLGRPAEPDGFAYWTGELRSGALNREQVIIGISESLEHQILALPAIEGGIAFT
jgi:hypothetical protein